MKDEKRDRIKKCANVEQKCSDVERSEMNGMERRAVEHVMAFLAQLNINGSALEERLHRVPGAWREWRLMIAMANKCVPKLYETLTPRQHAMMERLAENGETTVRLKSITNMETMAQIPLRSLRTIIEAAADGQCALCVKNEREIKSCPLRKALWDTVPPQYTPRFGCIYRDLAHGVDGGFDDEIQR